MAGEIGLEPPPDHSTPEAVAVLRTGLRALRELLDPRLGDALAGFRASFEGADRRLQRVAAYKALHDRLHDLQFRCFAPISRLVSTFPQPETTTQLRLETRTLQSELRKIREIAGGPSLTGDDLSWIEDNLALAETFLLAAAAETSVSRLQQAIALLRDVVQVQPPSVNKLLIDAVRALDLGQLVNSLSSITAHLATLDVDSELPAWVERAGRELQVLHSGLLQQIESHRLWQRVDDRMRLFESTIAQSGGDVQPVWALVESAVQRAVTGNEPWAAELRDHAGLVAEAVTAGAGASLPLYFLRFQTLASDRFYLVDKDLKQLCDRLTPVGKDLDAIVERMS